MKSKVAKGMILGTVALLLAIVPAIACHFYVNAHSPQCEKLHVNATYFGHSGKYYKIQIFLDGVKVGERISKKNVTETFNGTVAPGSRNIQIKVYEWRYVYWRFKAQTHRTVEVDACYQTCDQTMVGDVIYGDWSDWVLDEVNQIYTRERTVTTIFVDARDGETECSRETKTEIERKKYELCELTNTTYGEWSEWFYDVQTGMLKRTRIVEEYDALNPEHLCGSDVEEQFDKYIACEGEIEVIIGKWSDWYGHPPNMTRERTITYLDVNSGEVCDEVIEYQQECFADEFIWVWKLFMPNGSICELRDLGYDGTYTSPGVEQQKTYCCDVAETAHGYYVNNCESGFKYWYDLPRYNGCGRCE